MKRHVLTTVLCRLGFAAGLVIGCQWGIDHLHQHVEAMRVTEPDYRPCGLMGLPSLMSGVIGGVLGMLLGWRASCCFVTDPVLLGDEPEADSEYE